MNFNNIMLLAFIGLPSLVFVDSRPITNRPTLNTSKLNKNEMPSYMQTTIKPEARKKALSLFPKIQMKFVVTDPPVTKKSSINIYKKFQKPLLLKKMIYTTIKTSSKIESSTTEPFVDILNSPQSATEKGVTMQRKMPSLEKPSLFHNQHHVDHNTDLIGEAAQMNQVEVTLGSEESQETNTETIDTFVEDIHDKINSDLDKGYKQIDKIDLISMAVDNTGETGNLVREKRNSKYLAQDIEDINKDFEELILLGGFNNEIDTLGYDAILKDREVEDEEDLMTFKKHRSKRYIVEEETKSSTSTSLHYTDKTLSQAVSYNNINE